MSLSQKILNGDLTAASRLMTDIDEEIDSAIKELKELYPKTGKAWIIGITGSSGVGKSTLVNKMVEAFRSGSKTVGVIAVDPTSPFSGGAILGDRVRMQSHSTDEGVFIRSLATRGHLGGISRSTHDIIKVMDAMGKDSIFVETVGVGQDEVDIVNAADTTIVVLVPGLGDSIQAMKAGVLEIGDIFVINKCEQEGADQLEQELSFMLQMGDKPSKDWTIPIYRTEAIQGVGIEELIFGIHRHQEMLNRKEIRQLREKERVKSEFLEILKSSLMKMLIQKFSQNGDLDRMLETIAKRERDPYTVVEDIIRNILP
jgi:LAO/AO transport system kinase